MLTLKLKIEKFVKEQLWQIVFIIAVIASFAFFFGKEIEAFCFCVAHFTIRPKFDKQYHKPTTYGCLFLTSGILFISIMVAMPLTTSLLSTIPLAFFVAWVGYVVQDRLDLKELLLPKPFNVNTCTKSELIKRCEDLKFSQTNTELAVEFFIDKTPQKVIADRLSIDEKSVTTRKKRMKEKLNNK